MTDKLPSLVLTISIDRPTPENPFGYLCLQAQTKGEKPVFEDGADGSLNAATLAQIIADIRSYVSHGTKASWQSRVRPFGAEGHDQGRN